MLQKPRRKQNKKKTGCPACLHENVSGFGASYLESNFEATLKVVAESPEIGIHECRKCHSMFLSHESIFLKKRNYFTRLLGGRELKRVFHWINADLSIRNWLKAVERIGFTIDHGGDQLLPCEVSFKDGSTTSFGILKVTKRPPTGAKMLYQDVRFIDEVTSLRASPYGISSDIRNAAQSAREVESGFFPLLISAKGQKIVLDGLELLFDEHGIKGSDLEISNDPWEANNKDYLYSNHRLRPTFIIANT